MIPRSTYNGTFVLALHNHDLFFVKYGLIAYDGPLGPRLFLDNAQRTSSTERRHLRSLFIGEKFIDFKRRATIQKRSTAPTFVNQVYAHIAQDLVSQRLAA